MRVLQVNKYFYPRGGAEKSFFLTAEVLEKNGHGVSFFSMRRPENRPSAYEKYFLGRIDYDGKNGFFGDLKAVTRMLYSFEARRKVRELVRDERPDIAHLHNICHQISPSIIDELKDSGIPVVMTLHDFKLTCPVYTHRQNGGVCEACKGRRFYHALLGRCVRGSITKSALIMAEMCLHHLILDIYKKIDLFISPSRFLMEKTKEMGFAGNIAHLPNFIYPENYVPAYGSEEDNIVYFGRLSPEKGVATLIEAVKGLSVKLKIIGEGPQKYELLKKLRSEKIDNVELLGFKSGDSLHNEIRRSAFTVIPSEWYENNPMSLIESFALGKAVIGARVGGIPELVKDDETGLTFEAGSSMDLREKISSLLADKALAVRMGENARRLAEEELNPGRHYDCLMSIYKRLI
ncbi:MAG: glycosyltransferase [Nitrospirota bacterium]